MSAPSPAELLVRRVSRTALQSSLKASEFKDLALWASLIRFDVILAAALPVGSASATEAWRAVARLADSAIASNKEAWRALPALLVPVTLDQARALLRAGTLADAKRVLGTLRSVPDAKHSWEFFKLLSIIEARQGDATAVRRVVDTARLLHSSQPEFGVFAQCAAASDGGGLPTLAAFPSDDLSHPALNQAPSTAAVPLPEAPAPAVSPPTAPVPAAFPAPAVVAAPTAAAPRLRLPGAGDPPVRRMSVLPRPPLPFMSSLSPVAEDEGGAMASTRRRGGAPPASTSAAAAGGDTDDSCMTGTSSSSGSGGSSIGTSRSNVTTSRPSHTTGAFTALGSSSILSASALGGMSGATTALHHMASSISSSEEDGNSISSSSASVLLASRGPPTTVQRPTLGFSSGGGSSGANPTAGGAAPFVVPDYIRGFKAERRPTAPSAAPAAAAPAPAAPAAGGGASSSSRAPSLSSGRTAVAPPSLPAKTVVAATTQGSADAAWGEGGHSATTGGSGEGGDTVVLQHLPVRRLQPAAAPLTAAAWDTHAAATARSAAPAPSHAARMSVAAGGVSVRAAPGLDISADSSFEDEEAENTALQRRQQQQQQGGGGEMSPTDPTVQLNNRAVVRPPIAALSGPVRSAAVTLAPVEPPHQVTPPPQDMGRVGGAFESLSSACEVIRVANRSYLRLGCVGRGGSSRVYRVLGEDLAVYALKRVRLSRMEPGAVDTYRNEIALMRRLAGSRHIVSLVDAEVDWGAKCIHMVMELGQADLNAIVQQEKDRCTKHAAAAAGALSTTALPIAQPQGFMCMDENLLRLVWAQMLSAVDTIHCARIVHGDLKPANFVFVEGTLKLIDFGIAKALSADTTNIVRDSQVGTLNYMSPEAICAVDQRQHGGTAGLMSGGASLLKLGRASDIWSLGCILYQMVYGRTPFAELSLIHKLQAICDPNFSIAFPPISPANGAGGLAAVLHAGMHERFARVAAYRPSAVDVTADMSVGGGEDATFG